jgi:toxin HigB-1
MIKKVLITRRAEKEVLKIPLALQIKLRAWIYAVNKEGWEKTKIYPAHRDEALLGKRWGQRSVRLSKAYRVIYSVIRDKSGEYLLIQEVNKHEY